MQTVTNTANVYSDASRENNVKHASATFSIFNSSDLIMTKTTDKQTYFSGDNITFTIVVENTTQEEINGLFFSDEIDSSLLPLSGNEYGVVTTSGTIVSKESPVTIKDISIGANSSITITIIGVIA